MIEATLMRQTVERSFPRSPLGYTAGELLIYRFRLSELLQNYTQEDGLVLGSLRWLILGRYEASKYARRFLTFH